MSDKLHMVAALLIPKGNKNFVALSHHILLSSLIVFAILKPMWPTSRGRYLGMTTAQRLKKRLQHEIR